MIPDWRQSCLWSLAALASVAAILYLNGLPNTYSSFLHIPVDYLLAALGIATVLLVWLPWPRRLRNGKDFCVAFVILATLILPVLSHRFGILPSLLLSAIFCPILAFSVRGHERLSRKWPWRYALGLSAMPPLLLWQGKSFSIALYSGFFVAGMIAGLSFVALVSQIYGGSLQMEESRGSALPFKASLLVSSSLFGSLSWIWVFALLFGPLLFLGSACEPVRPSVKLRPDASKSTGTVAFNFEGDSFSLLEDELPLTLRIRLFPIVDGQILDQEGDAVKYVLDGAENAFEVKGIKLGRKKFQLHILNGREEVVGEGEFVLVVNLGSQTLDQPIVIRLREPERRRRNVRLVLAASIDLPNAEPKTTYLDVEETLDDYCIGCHNTSSLENGLFGALDLSRFPFVSASEYYENQQQIVNDMIYSMESLTEPMPPMAPFVPQPEIDVVKKWMTDGLPKRPGGSDETAVLLSSARAEWQLANSEESGSLAFSSNDAQELETLLPDAVIDGAYTMRYSILAEDGKETHGGEWSVIVPPSGDLSLEVVVPYEEPAVEIPVIIESGTGE